MSAAIVAFGAVSGLGDGWDAVSAGEIDAPARVAIARDDLLVKAGLERPFAARVQLDSGEGHPGTRILWRAFEACASSLDVVKPGWRALRVGIAIGTSSGGDVERAKYAEPLAALIARSGISFAPRTLILGACASSAIAMGLAARWLAEGACDLVLAGGFDVVSPFVASGFEALRATSERVPPRPFRQGRDGMALGEGAAVLAMVRGEDAGPGALAYVAGFGASADAVHLTAPDRTGGGLARAAEAALVDAGSPGVDLVSAHATATPFNDAAESRAIASLGAAIAPTAIVHAFKAQIGHTLGAAGALESLACVDAFRRGVLPATAGEGPLDPDAPARLLDRTAAGAPRVALKLASAFGGANAALVLTRDPPTARPARARRDVVVSPSVDVHAIPPLAELARALGIPLDRVTRADALVHFAFAAVHALGESLGVSLEGAGIVVGTARATVETNAIFAARLRDRGPRFVEPRRFPYTSPNAVAGECAIAFKLTGPAFTVGLGPDVALEARSVASTLVRAGDADRVVVLAVESSGPASAALVFKPI